MQLFTCVYTQLKAEAPIGEQSVMSQRHSETPDLSRPHTQV